MKRWTPRRFIALALGVMFALGTVASTVQAADMAAQMSAGPAMGAGAAPDGCAGGCGGSDQVGSMASCVMVCPNAVQAVMPSAGPVVAKDASAWHPKGEFALTAQFARPDPNPPKPTVLI